MSNTRSTISYFRASIPDYSKAFTRRTKTLMLAHLKTDMKELPRKVVCMLCKARLSQECFRPTTLKHLCASNGIHCLQLMESRAEEWYCGDHVANAICGFSVPGHANEGGCRRWIRKKAADMLALWEWCLAERHWNDRVCEQFLWRLSSFVTSTI